MAGWSCVDLSNILVVTVSVTRPKIAMAYGCEWMREVSQIRQCATFATIGHNMLP